MSDLALPYVMPPIVDPEMEFAKYRNFLAALQDRRQRRTVAVANPFDLTIDLTSACQLSCPYCSTGNGTIARGRAVIRDELYHKLLGSVGDDCFIVWYFSNGEPLLHKRFGELVATTKDQRIFSVISTNLSLELSDDYLHKLLTCGLGIISASIDGACAETYRQYRRGGDFDLVMRNVRRLVEMKRNLGLTYPLIEWRFLRFRHNEHEEFEARALAHMMGVDLIEFWPGVAPPEGSPFVDGVMEARKPLVGPPVAGPALKALGTRQAQNRVLARLVPRVEVGGHAELASFTRKCDWLYFSGMLHPNGRVGPCCVSNDEPDDFVDSVDEYPSYHALFNSPNYTAARAMFTEGAPSGTICDRCPNPSAQHYQFRMKMRAVLRNAPEWVAGVLARDPGAYFLPEDQVLVPEVDAVWSHAGVLVTLADPHMEERLREAALASAAE